MYLVNPASETPGKVYDKQRGVYLTPEALSTGHPTVKRLTAVASSRGALYEDYGESGSIVSSGEVFSSLLSPLLPAESRAPPIYVPRLFPAQFKDRTVQLGVGNDMHPFPVALNTHLFPVGIVEAVVMIDHSAKPSIIPFLGSPFSGEQTLWYIMKKAQPLGRTSGEFGIDGSYAAPAWACVMLHMAIISINTVGVATVTFIEDNGTTVTDNLGDAIKSDNPRIRLAFLLVEKQYPNFMSASLTLRAVAEHSPGNELSMEAARTPQGLREMAPVTVLE